MIAAALNLDDPTKVEFRIGRADKLLADTVGIQLDTTYLVAMVAGDNSRNVFFYGSTPTGNDPTDYTNLFKLVLETIINLSVEEFFTKPGCKNGSCKLRPN